MYMPLYLYIQNINDKIKKKKEYQSDVRATISKAVNVMPQGHIAHMSNKDQLIKSFTKLNTMDINAQKYFSHLFILNFTFTKNSINLL